MADPFLGEIRMFAGNFAPVGWNMCDGTVVSISEYDALFSLIGTTYGGDGISTFGLPDLRSRVPVHTDRANYPLGMVAGAETVTLTRDQLAGHTHPTRCFAGDGTVPAPKDDVWAATADFNAYSTSGVDSSMNSAAITTVGGSQPHDNMPPFLVLNFIIALNGIYPPRP